jgi:hypothetical protein
MSRHSWFPVGVFHPVLPPGLKRPGRLSRYTESQGLTLACEVGELGTQPTLNKHTMGTVAKKLHYLVSCMNSADYLRKIAYLLTMKFHANVLTVARVSAEASGN